MSLDETIGEVVGFETLGSLAFSRKPREFFLLEPIPIAGSVLCIIVTELPERAIRSRAFWVDNDLLGDSLPNLVP